MENVAAMKEKFLKSTVGSECRVQEHMKMIPNKILKQILLLKKSKPLVLQTYNDQSDLKVQTVIC